MTDTVSHETRNWLARLRPGDKVLVQYPRPWQRLLYGPPHVAIVDRVMPTQLQVDGERYYRFSGVHVGRKHEREYASWLVEWTEEREREWTEAFAAQLAEEEEREVSSLGYEPPPYSNGEECLKCGFVVCCCDQLEEEYRRIMETEGVLEEPVPPAEATGAKNL